MKYKYIGLLSVAFLMCTTTTFSVYGATQNNTNVNPTTAATQTSNNVIVASKNIKVNKKANLTKTLKLNKSTVKNYTFTSSKTKVATVTQSGKITGKKSGSTVITVKSKIDNAVYATVNVNVKNRYSAKDLRLMSSIIYSEAGNQSYAGKKAVGIVIMNRIKSKSFPNNLKSVIYQPGQFTPTRNGSLNRSLSLYDNGKLDKECIKAAKAVLNGDKKVTVSSKNINMKSFLFFSGYVKGSRLSIDGHQFK